MSFTSDVKEELSRVEPVCSHCDRAQLAAIIRIEGTLFFSGKNRYRVEVATDTPSVARLVIRLVHEIYGLKTELTVRRSVLHQTPNYLINIPVQPKLAEALVDLGVLGEDGLELGIKPSLVNKQCCAAAYLRGAFLGSGFVSNPRGDFHFEITVESEPLANGLVELMAEKGIAARVQQRRNSYMVYLKSGEASAHRPEESSARRYHAGQGFRHSRYHRPQYRRQDRLYQDFGSTLNDGDVRSDDPRGRPQRDIRL